MIEQTVDVEILIGILDTYTKKMFRGDTKSGPLEIRRNFRLFPIVGSASAT